MISKEEILRFHKLSIAKYAGSHGIRDEGILESAIARPYQTSGGEDLFQTVYEKAGAIMQRIIINHPFVDDNRTGFPALFAIISKGNMKLTATDEDIYTFAIRLLPVKQKVKILYTG